MKDEDDVENRETGDKPILKEEVQKVVRMMKDGKLPGVGNIPAEALTPVNSSENNCFADDAVKEAEEPDTPLSSVSI